MISGLPDSERQCPVVRVQGVQFNDDLEEENNALASCGEMKTLDDLTLENFVFSNDLLPSIDLTKDLAKNIDTTTFEQKNKELVLLTEKVKLDEKKMKKLQVQTQEAEMKILEEQKKAKLAERKILQQQEKAKLAERKILQEQEKAKLAEQKILQEQEKAKLAERKILQEQEKAKLAEMKILGIDSALIGALDKKGLKPIVATAVATTCSYLGISENDLKDKATNLGGVLLQELKSKFFASAPVSSAGVNAVKSGNAVAKLTTNTASTVVDGAELAAAGGNVSKASTVVADGAELAGQAVAGSTKVAMPLGNFFHFIESNSLYMFHFI